MCNAWNHCYGCPCGFGGNTGDGDGSTATKAAWTLEAVGRPLTFRTSCCWCGARVYFYRNENGGCALFERLGWPWELHPCWARHSAERVSQRSRVSIALERAGFDGSAYFVQGVLVEAPQKPRPAATKVMGFIVDLNVEETSFSADDDVTDAPEWTQIHVMTEDDRLYPVWAPTPWVETSHLYDHLALAVRWLRWDDDLYLFAVSMECQVWGTRRTSRRRVQAIADGEFSCFYCDQKLGGKRRWGFGPGLHLECRTCSRLRTAVAPASLVQICKRIAATHA